MSKKRDEDLELDEVQEKKKYKHTHKFRATKIVGKDGKYLVECTTCFTIFD